MSLPLSLERLHRRILVREFFLALAATLSFRRTGMTTETAGNCSRWADFAFAFRRGRRDGEFASAACDWLTERVSGPRREKARA
jgi:hypothetical protein